MSVGKIEAGAIKLDIWTNQPADKPFEDGDRVVIHFKADRPCYVMVANVSSTGNVSIVFPNKEHTDNRIDGGKEYVLFGDDSQLKLVMGKGVSEPKLVFYTSSVPFELSGFKVPDDQAVLAIPATARDRLKMLRESIARAARNKGFNLQVLSLKGKPQGKVDLKLMGGPWGGKSVRPVETSETPGAVTGSRGHREDLKNLNK